MTKSDIELGEISLDTTDSSSYDRDFLQQKRAARRRAFQSSDTHRTQPAGTSASNGRHDEPYFEGAPLLLCLRLVACYHVPVFSVRRGRKWNTREDLGRGVTFAVQQADLPVREAVSDLQYYDITKGKREGFFTDHTGIKWSLDTVVAYKSLGASGRIKRDGLFSDLLKELRILCHPPLQRHPNIAHFIGLAWVREEDIASETVPENEMTEEGREWPILITERAELGTLGDFVQREAHDGKRISLLAKIRLLSDVLEALLDLHSCKIIHGDVKSSNVLVFTNTIGTAENWTAKVIDFGHAVIHAENSSDITNRDQLLGTDLYRPPELAKPGATFDGNIADRTDIWCWGMLLWEVLLDGRLDVTRQAMQSLRESGSVAQFALGKCKTHLENHHKNERRMFPSVLQILSEALNENPSLRPSAAVFVSKVRALAQHSILTARPERSFSKVASLHELPPFNLMHQHSNLRDTIYIPQQIFKALQAALASDQGRNPGAIEFQLGLCHAVGFGVERSYQETIRLFSKSAAQDFRISRIILRRAATALAVELDPLIERSNSEWSDGFSDTETFRQLLVSSPPRGPVFGALGYQSLEVDSTTHVPTDTTGDERLIKALKLGQVADIQTIIQEVKDINFQLDSGESALHFAVFFQDSNVAAAILGAGGDVLQCTTAECEFSIAGMHKQRIPSNVSPLVLTVLLDRVELLKMFLQPRLNNMDKPEKEETLVDLLAWGAQYQSADCVEYLCKQFRDHPMHPFDQRGVNPLSYAVQSEFLFRLMLFTPYKKSTQAKTPPLIDLQLTIVKRLLDAGFPLQADESTGLNCLHIAAATSDATLLKVLLKCRSSSKHDELEEKSPDGFSPLGISITRGRKDAYWELAEAGSNLSQAWPEIGGHALHCCAMYPSAASSMIATQILKKHPKAVHARDKMWRTPLHCAAFRENSDMIEILIAARADIAARDFDSYTPLGAAVSGRNKRAIRQICDALNSKRQPLISWTFTDPFLEVGWLTYSPLEQLLSPGTISPARQPEMRLEQNRVGVFGCCDHPFSPKSMEVLNVLLECYKHTTRFGVNFFEHMFFSPNSYSGLEAAVSMGNIKAVKLLLGSKLFKPDYRCLVLYAHNQRMVGASHIADEGTRKSMLQHLEDCQCNDFKTRRKRRTTSWLSLLWKSYYLCYGDLEQKQWERASEWLWANRWYEYRPLFLEFVPWISTRWSVNVISFCIGWIFMLPMIVYFVIIHRIPRTECPRSRKIYAIVCFIMANVFLLAPQIFSVLSVLYRRCRAQYHGHDTLLAYLQSSFSLFVAAGCCYLCYLLQPGQEMIFPDFPSNSFTPQQLSWIATFGSLSQALEGVLIAVPAAEFLMMIFMTIVSERVLKRWSGGRIDTKPRPKHLNDYTTYMPWTRIGYIVG